MNRITWHVIVAFALVTLGTSLTGCSQGGGPAPTTTSLSALTVSQPPPGAAPLPGTGPAALSAVFTAAPPTVHALVPTFDPVLNQKTFTYRVLVTETTLTVTPTSADAGVTIVVSFPPATSNPTRVVASGTPTTFTFAAGTLPPAEVGRLTIIVSAPGSGLPDTVYTVTISPVVP